MLLGQGGSETIYISSSQLNKIFLDGKCLERTKIYHYHDLGTGRYVITTDKQEASDNGTAGRYDNGDGSNDGAGGSTNSDANMQAPDFDISGENMSCKQLLGPDLVKVLKLCINAIRIAGIIIGILNGMMSLIPALTSGDASALNKAIKKCIWIAVIILLIALLPVFLKVIGNLFGFDLTCIF